MIVLFDGVCNLCSRVVNFIIKRDNNNVFKFTALQSDTGIEIINKFGLEKDRIYTIILVDNEKCYQKSTAILNIVKNLRGLWKLFYGLILIPPFLRNPLYDFIAKNRYKWFGKQDRCMVPDAGIIRKFLK